MILRSSGWTASALFCAAALTTPTAHARDLAPVDALGRAPLVAQFKSGSARAATSETPANVQRLLREERLGLPTFVQLNPSASTTSLSKTRAKDPETAARSALKTLAPLYGLTSAEVDAAPLHHVQTMGGGAQLVRLTNQRDGIEVFREHATFATVLL